MAVWQSVGMENATQTKADISALSRAELSALYVQEIGYEPFAEGWTEAEVRDILAERFPFGFRLCIAPVLSEDSRRFVWEWVWSNSVGEFVSGGYCATRAEAVNDATLAFLLQ